MQGSEDLDYGTILQNVLVPPGTFPDCYAFSLHKAGSTLMHSMIYGACKLAKIPAVSIPDALFKVGIFEKDWQEDRKILELLVPGRIYIGFRHLPPILLDEAINLKQKKSVLLVRDPRDALVSQYFSFGGKYISHKMPESRKEVLLEKAKSTQHLSIDEYVLRMSRNYLGKLQAYRDNLDFGNVLLRRYEDIYYDKRRFLGEIFEHFGLSVESTILDEVADINDVRPEAEDPTKHIRKGVPGDHVEKLMPQTISQLNDVFAEVCDWFGYDLHK